MKITGIDQTSHTSPLPNELIVPAQLRAHLRALGTSTGREFVVMRDPVTQRFVVRVLEPGTKTVLDQFPAESILKQLPPKE